MAEKTPGQTLRDYRRERDVSQDELAEALGLAHKSSISKREAGAIPMTRSELLEACAAVERMVEDRISRMTPAEVLGV